MTYNTGFVMYDRGVREGDFEWIKFNCVFLMPLSCFMDFFLQIITHDHHLKPAIMKAIVDISKGTKKTVIQLYIKF